MRSGRRGGVVALVGGCTAGVAAAVALAAGPAGGAVPFAESAGSVYRGFVSLLGGGGRPVRSGSQGAG